MACSYWMSIGAGAGSSKPGHEAGSSCGFFFPAPEHLLLFLICAFAPLRPKNFIEDLSLELVR